MYAFFDKFGKKLLAVVAAMLALAFILPSTFSGGGGGGGARFGTIDGQAIDPVEVQAAQNALAQLERVVYQGQGDGGRPQRAVLPLWIFQDNALYRQLQSNPLHLYLLMHEAREAGAVVDEREIDEMLGANARLEVGENRELEMDRVSQPVKDALRSAVRQVRMITTHLNRVEEAAVKVSGPLADDRLARTIQRVKTHIASLSATDYVGKVAAPTEDELKRLFDAYKGVQPAVSESNPFGFGYGVPDRIGVQYLVVPQAEVATAVEASQPAGRWEEEAIIYYRNNAQGFQSATSQPTTRPFADVRADVLRTLRQPKIADKSRQVATRITQALDAAAPKSAATTGPTTRQALTGDAFTFDALQKIADTVQKQTGVRATVVAPAGPLSLADLARQPGFGESKGPSFLFTSLRVLNAVPKGEVPLSTMLDLGRPAPAVSGPDGLYVARVVSFDPAHPADYEAVKAAVEKDVRRSKAFALATADAQALVEKAAAGGGLSKVAKDVQISHAFNADDVAPGGLTGDWTGATVGPAFDALRGVTNASALPIRTVVKIEASDRVAVVEVVDVETSLTTVTEEFMRSQMARGIGRQYLPDDSRALWFAFDSVAKRSGYKPDASTEQAPKSDPAGPRGPTNPFMPG